MESRSAGQFEKTDVFLSIKASKPILSETQNKIMNLNMSTLRCYVNTHRVALLRHIASFTIIYLL